MDLIAPVPAIALFFFSPQKHLILFHFLYPLVFHRLKRNVLSLKLPMRWSHGLHDTFISCRLAKLPLFVGLILRDKSPLSRVLASSDQQQELIDLISGSYRSSNEGPIQNMRWVYSIFKRNQTLFTLLWREMQSSFWLTVLIQFDWIQVKTRNRQGDPELLSINNKK